MMDAYKQICVELDCVPRTAFAMPWGTLYYSKGTVMVPLLSNEPFRGSSENTSDGLSTLGSMTYLREPKRLPNIMIDSCGFINA
jgi:hypothetical protein